MKQKNNCIKSLHNYLINKYEKNSFAIRDNWEDDFDAIGYVDKTETYLIYISATSGEDTFYVALEDPPIDTEKYKPAGDFDDIDLKMLEYLFCKHLRINKN